MLGILAKAFRPVIAGKPDPTLTQLDMRWNSVPESAWRPLRPPLDHPGQVRCPGAGATAHRLRGQHGPYACASVLVGLSATLAQDYVPAAAALARPTAVQGGGTVMTGLLLGILLSRVSAER